MIKKDLLISFYLNNRFINNLFDDYINKRNST